MNDPKFALNDAVLLAGDTTQRGAVVNVCGVIVPGGKKYRYRVRFEDGSERMIDEPDLTAAPARP